jgi:hypothetical protein
MSDGPIDFGTNVQAPARPPTGGERALLLGALNGLSKKGEHYAVVYPGDNVLSVYASLASIAGLNSDNRATLLMMPGTYSLPGYLVLTSNVNVVGVGTYDGAPSVTLVPSGAYGGVILRGSNILVKGIRSEVIRLYASATNCDLEDCEALGIYGFSFLTVGLNSSVYTEDYLYDGPPGEPVFLENLSILNSSFTRCVGGEAAFGLALTNCKLFKCTGNVGSFGCNFIKGSLLEDCVCTGSYGFTGNYDVSEFTSLILERKIESSILRRCVSAGSDAFGETRLIDSRFEFCRSSYSSFLGLGETTGCVFEDCEAGDYSFAPQYPPQACVFRRCKAGNNSFGGDAILSPGPSNSVLVFEDCEGGAECFGAGMLVALRGSSLTPVEERIPYVFKNCRAGVYSFGRDAVCFGKFENCSAGYGSFGTAVCVGIFRNCYCGDSFTRIPYASLPENGFGVFGAIAGYFENCTIPLQNNLSNAWNFDAPDLPDELRKFEAVNCVLYSNDTSYGAAVSSPTSINIRDSIFYVYGDVGTTLSAIVSALEGSASPSSSVGVYNCYIVEVPIGSGSNTDPLSIKLPANLPEPSMMPFY